MLLQEKLIDKKILLASKSPRRQELLKGLGLSFEVVEIEVEETYPENLKREKITEFISAKKASAYEDLSENEILITADTLVWLEGKVLGKPKHEEEAFEMIEKMSGKFHEVFTSVTLKSNLKSTTFSELTAVFFDEFEAEEIKYYLNEFKPFDKAGAYGIQEWLGFAKISKIEGCYYNVMGLPLNRIYKELMNF